MMGRREFISLLGGAAAMSVEATAQPAQLRTVGFLGSGTPATAGGWVAAFTQRLRELGWIEDRTIRIDLRWADGRNDRSAEIAAEFVRQKVDVIVTYSSEQARIAKQATSTIPIVAALLGDAVGLGLVASLARPGANLTGLESMTVDLGGKLLELLRELVPGLRRLAILGNVNAPSLKIEIGNVWTAANALGLEISVFEISRAEDIGPAITTIATQADALFVVGEPLTFSHRTRINTLALAARLPTTYTIREYVEAGGLMSYGASFPPMFRRAADYVDKILRGANPGELPIEQPTRYHLVVNLTTAKALGLTVPEAFLLRADEVIE
jgi:putative ABC transport system substrate-binding protein